ncbi:unnamed protein product [Lepeophtheirus salmonis]|uniref:(salmon louse) hypothetical protein n=1 Tax=Lepeophtheirus salmonis TaxID=72036 RepID=A0A7R8H069_LEPSM|nr:unnamed protein product [Lepeophtheirus salmonis]CAF2780197.1 unnamed protein product [Lepeophtheirus salmonis]
MELHLTKSFRVKALRTDGQVKNPKVAKKLELFTKEVKEIGFVRSNPNEGSHKNHPTLKSSNIFLGFCSVAFDVVGESANLPSLLPVIGHIIKLEFDRIKKHYSNSFKFGQTYIRSNKNKSTSKNTYKIHWNCSFKRGELIASLVDTHSQNIGSLSNEEHCTDLQILVDEITSSLAHNIPNQSLEAILHQAVLSTTPGTE